MRLAALLPFLCLLALSACSDVPAADAGSNASASVAAEPAPAAGLRPIALRVPDMACRLCARPIEANLARMGVRDVRVDLDSKWVTGRFDPARLTPEAIRARIEALKFRVAEVRVG